MWRSRLKYVFILCGLISLAGIGHSVWVNRAETNEAFGPVVGRLVDTSKQIVTEAKTIYESKKSEMETPSELARPTADLNQGVTNTPVVSEINWRAMLTIEQGLDQGGFAPYVLDRYVVNEQTGGKSIFVVLKQPLPGSQIESAQKVAQKWFCERMNSLGIAPQDRPVVVLELQSNFGEVLDSAQFSVMNC